MSFPGKLAPFLPLGGIPRGSRLHRAANITLLRLCHTWTENARRPIRGAALFVFFVCGGVCTCRGRRPDVPSARRCRAVRPPLGGAVGAADWGREKRGASLPPSALRADTSLSEGGEGRRIPTPVFALARNDRERADRVVRPYKGLSKIPGRDVVPQGHLFRCAPRQDGVPTIFARENGDAYASG